MSYELPAGCRRRPRPASPARLRAMARQAVRSEAVVESGAVRPPDGWILASQHFELMDAVERGLSEHDRAAFEELLDEARRTMPPLRPDHPTLWIEKDAIAADMEAIRAGRTPWRERNGEFS